MPRAFISYSRKDGGFAQQLFDALTQGGRDCWIDLKGIPPTAEWLEEIREAIDGADAFVFIISPDSCSSDICQAEVAHAVGRHKRLIPLHYRDTPRDAIPAAIAKLNWIFFRDPAAFSADVASVEAALDTDLEWAADHTRLLVRAVDWDRQKRDASYTLRGRDLQHFEQWLAAAPDKEPAPASLQSEYVLASRRATTRRQRIVWSSVFAAVSIALVLSVIAYFQSRERERQQRLASARQLVNQADAIRALPVDSPEAQGQLRDSARVAIRALQMFDALGVPSVEADQALRSSLSLLPVAAGEHQLGKDTLDATGFDPAGRYLAVALGNRQVTVWDGREGKQVATCDVIGGDGDEILAVAVASNGESAAVSRRLRGAANGTIDVWRLPACQHLFQTVEQDRYENVLLDPQGRWVGTRFLRRIALWDIATGNAIPSGLGEDIVTATAVDATGNVIAIAHRQQDSREYRLSLWRVSEGDLTVEWPLQERPTSIQWIANPSRLLVAGAELVYIYDAATGKTIARFPAPNRPFTASADGTLVAEDVGNYVVEIRDVSGAVVRSRLSHAHEVKAMAFRQDPDGATLTTVELGAAAKVMRSWRVGSSAVAVISKPTPIERVSFSSDSTLVHVSDAGGAQSWRLSANPNGPVTLSPVAGALPAEVGERFRVATDNPAARSGTRPSVRIIRISDGADVARYEFERQIVATVLSNDGNTLAVATAQATRGGWQAELHVSNVPSKQTNVAPLSGFQEDRYIRALTLSPTGTYAAVASRRGFAVLDSRTLKPITELSHPFPGGIGFQAAGSLVATTGIDRRTRVWDLESNLEIARVIDDTLVKNLALSPDGRWLATVTETGVVRIWAVRSADLIRQACARIGEPCLYVATQ